MQYYPAPQEDAFRLSDKNLEKEPLHILDLSAEERGP